MSVRVTVVSNDLIIWTGSINLRHIIPKRWSLKKYFGLAFLCYSTLHNTFMVQCPPLNTLVLHVEQNVCAIWNQQRRVVSVFAFKIYQRSGYEVKCIDQNYKRPQSPSPYDASIYRQSTWISITYRFVCPICQKLLIQSKIASANQYV